MLGLANTWQAVTFCGFPPKAALSSIIPFFLLFISLFLFDDMTLAGLDDTHTLDGMGMDGRDLVQLSGQRNGQMISVFVFFSTMDDTSITVRYTIYTWTKKHLQNH